jgi:hypothetical protein
VSSGCLVHRSGVDVRLAGDIGNDGRLIGIYKAVLVRIVDDRRLAIKGGLARVQVAGWQGTRNTSG